MRIIELESHQEKIGGYSYLESIIYGKYHHLFVCDREEYFFQDNYSKCFNYRYIIII